MADGEIRIAFGKDGVFAWRRVLGSWASIPADVALAELQALRPKPTATGEEKADG